MTMKISTNLCTLTVVLLENMLLVVILVLESEDIFCLVTKTEVKEDPSEVPVCHCCCILVNKRAMLTSGA